MKGHVYFKFKKQNFNGEKNTCLIIYFATESSDKASAISHDIVHCGKHCARDQRQWSLPSVTPIWYADVQLLNTEGE